TLFEVEKDLVEVDRAHGNKRRGGIRGRAGELLVVGGDEAIVEIGIGGLERSRAMGGEFLDETILQSAIEPLHAAAGLRGVAGNVLDAELLQGAADLREARAIHALPGPARIKRPGG